MEKSDTHIGVDKGVALYGTTERSGRGSGDEGNVVPKNKRFCKRVLDLSAVLVTSPLWLTALALGAIWIKMVSKGAIFYQQERIGLGGEVFVIFKFRTMVEGADTAVHEDYLKELISSNSPMKKLDGADSRLIRGGRLIRATGLDELPQLFNVIIGNMSIVGPRPCTPAELGKYTQPFMRRFRGLPGITGNWQVNGKNETTFRRMIALDILYLRNVSLRQDLWIMARTIPTLSKQILDLYEKKKLRQTPRQKSSKKQPRAEHLVPHIPTTPPAPRLVKTPPIFAQQAESQIYTSAKSLMDSTQRIVLNQGKVVADHLTNTQRLRMAQDGHSPES